MSVIKILNDLGLFNIEKIKQIKSKHTNVYDVVYIYYKRTGFNIFGKKKTLVFKRLESGCMKFNRGKEERFPFTSVSPQFQTIQDNIHHILKK